MALQWLSALIRRWEWEIFPFFTLYWQGLTTPPAPTASFRSQTILITGASGAVCSETARIFIDLGADTLIFAVPDIPEGPDGEPMVEKLLETSRVKKAHVVVWHLDMTSFESVNALAKRVNELPRLDVALMGAGIITPTRQETVDGWEYTLQINHLACAQLEALIIPKLVKSAENHNTTGVLSVITSLSVRTAWPRFPTPGPGQTLLQVMNNKPLRKGYIQQEQYGCTKLVHLHFLRQLSKFVHSSSGKNISTKRLQIHAADFGVVGYGRGLATSSFSARMFGWIFGRTAEMAARVVANSCAVHEDSNGALFLDYEKIPYYAFMTAGKGTTLQKMVWDETWEVLRNVSTKARAFHSDIE